MKNDLTLEDIFGNIFKRKEKDLMHAVEAEEKARKINLEQIRNYIEEEVHCGESYCSVKKIFPTNIKILESYGYKVEKYEAKLVSLGGDYYENRYKISWGKEE